MRVEKRTIDDQMESLTFHTHHFPGTTCTVAIAVLPDGFVAGAGKAPVLIQHFSMLKQDVILPSVMRNLTQPSDCGNWRAGI